MWEEVKTSARVHVQAESPDVRSWESNLSDRHKFAKLATFRG